MDLADQRGLIDVDHLRTANSAALQAVLRNHSPAATRSELEEQFLTLCDDRGIKRPETNSRIEGIEVDGYAYHRSPAAFASDRARDVTLKLAGWDVLRFTWAQLRARPVWVAAAVR